LHATVLDELDIYLLRFQRFFQRSEFLSNQDLDLAAPSNDLNDSKLDVDDLPNISQDDILEIDAVDDTENDGGDGGGGNGNHSSGSSSLPTSLDYSPFIDSQNIWSDLRVMLPNFSPSQNMNMMNSVNNQQPPPSQETTNTNSNIVNNHENKGSSSSSTGGGATSNPLTVHNNPMLSNPNRPISAVSLSNKKILGTTNSNELTTLPRSSVLVNPSKLRKNKTTNSGVSLTTLSSSNLASDAIRLPTSSSASPLPRYIQRNNQSY